MDTYRVEILYNLHGWGRRLRVVWTDIVQVPAGGPCFNHAYDIRTISKDILCRRYGLNVTQMRITYTKI